MEYTHSNNERKRIARKMRNVWKSDAFLTAKQAVRANKKKSKQEFRTHEQLLDKHGSPQDRIMIAKNKADGRGSFSGF